MFGWQEVLDFWFGKLDAAGLPEPLPRKRWFRSTRAFDWEIRRRFLTLSLVASEGGLESWRHKPGGALAEIILLDQFTRNIHRGRAMAYDNDAQAQRLCRTGLDRGQDVALADVMRAFFYMPLQHSEKIEDQERGVALYEQLAASSEGQLRALLATFFDSAVQHRDLIVRFGRFPHRNRVLGRHSTPQEQAFLEDGAARFGQ
jgi:uncharacterized protein (DUF924 family)